MVASAVNLADSDLTFSVTPKATGRPSKFTDENCAILLNALKDGLFIEDACSLANLDYSTYARWQQHARANGSSSPYYEFFNLVQATESAAKHSLVRQWREHFPHDYKAIRDYMARRWPDQYADQSRRTLTVEGTIHTTSVAVIASTSLPDLYRLLAGAGGLIEGHSELPMPVGEPESAG